MSELAQDPVREHALHGGRAIDRRVAIGIMVVTSLAAGAAFLQRQAATRQADADRSARGEAVRAVRLQGAVDDALDEIRLLANAGDDLHRVASQTSHDRSSLGQALSHAQAAAAARLDRLPLQVFRADARPDGTFDTRRFVVGAAEPQVETEQLAEANANARGAWSSHRSAYVAVITVFAVAVFLLGLTLTTEGLARSFLAGGGALFVLGGLVWGLWTWTSAVERPDRAAIRAYARASAIDSTLSYYPDASERGSYRAVVAGATAAILRRADYQQAYALRAIGELALDLTRPGGPVGSPAALADEKRATQLDPSDYFAWVKRGEAEFWLGHYDAAREAALHAFHIAPDLPNATLDLVLDFRISGDEADYVETLRTLRLVFSVAPSPVRQRLVTSFGATIALAARYRPQIAAIAQKVYEDVSAIG